jgi:hypothetical protein
VQPESNTIVVVSFSLIETVNRKLENSSRRQQQSLLPLLQQPRDETMELSASIPVNVRVLVVTNLNLQKAIVAGVHQDLTCAMLAALSQLARLANSQNLRAHLPDKPSVFSELQMATALLPSNRDER